MILQHIAADAGHLRHPGYGAQLRLEEEVLHGAQFRKIMFTAFQCIHEYLPHGRAGRTQRRLHPLRQTRQCLLYFFIHHLPGKINIHPVFKDDGHHREAKGGGGPYFLHLRQTPQLCFQGIGNLILYFLRSSSHPVGKDKHLVFT